MSPSSPHTDGLLAGRWRLVPESCPDDHVPTHRVDLIFYEEPDGPRGAVLARTDGSEVPLQALVFDGVELRLKVGPPPGQPPGDPPWLVVTLVDGRFEGGWAVPGLEHMRLKLVRQGR